VSARRWSRNYTKKLIKNVASAITQFLSCEALYGESDVLITHMKGLESIANLRGGLKKLGWNDELGAIAGG
jgi:hypothetical protein